MAWLNYHHLLYFWTTVREGSVSAAARKLRLAQGTVSEQLRALEHTLDVELFTRTGGRLRLTETGSHVYRYADEIFALGRELQETLQGQAPARAPRLQVGVADVLSKLIVSRLLEPALKLPEPVRMVCVEAKQDRLLAELAVHALDVVLTDEPVAPGGAVRAYNHLLGESGLTWFAEPKLARQLARNFPASLRGAPVLLPTEGTSMRRLLGGWLDGERLRPSVRGEFQDAALLKEFGRMGVGAFAAPSAIEDAVCAQYGVAVAGRVEAVRTRYYAVTVERKLRHPAVAAISAAAREELFAR